MSEPEMWGHEHDELAECVKALESAQTFLHHELDEADADLIRHHLHACEKCMENFDIESTITEMIRSSQRNDKAPRSLVTRIQSLRVSSRPESRPH